MTETTMGAGLGTLGGDHKADAARSLKRIERMAMLLDARFRIPIVNVCIGWDGILGLAPGVGDLLTLVFSCYLLLEAVKMRMPFSVLGRMLVNILIDTGIGAIPVAGDLFDVLFKANLRNSRLLRRQLERRAAKA